MQMSYGIGSFLFPLGIKNKSFSGEFEFVTSKKLVDGDITQTATRVKVYRATDGSTRFEDYQKDKEGDKIYAVSIYNHDEQRIYFLDVESKAFYIMPVSDSGSQPDPKSELPIASDQNIGKKSIENLTCLGYQRKQKENDVFEYWVSEELNQVMLAKSVLGDEINTLRLFSIKQSEPDNKLFIVPKDYKPIQIE